MRIFTIAVVTSFFCSSYAYSQNQTMVKPSVWLRGDVKESSLQWTDFSANKINGTSLTSEFPSLGVLNFNPVRTFDGANDYISIAKSLETLNGFTVVTVFQPADTTERGIWGDENGSARKAFLTTKRVLGPDDAVDSYSASGNNAVIQTTVQSWEKPGTPMNDAFIALGSNGKSRNQKLFKGAIAEFLLFDRPLDFIERVQVETFLAIKYGIGLIDRNYVSSGLKVLWHGENNKGYATRLTGIGRDDVFHLYQKQSVNVNDTSRFIQLSVGVLAKSNDENKSIINDQDFLVWGDNAGVLDTKPGEGPDSVLAISQRRWLMRATGLTAKQMNTELQIDLSKLPPSSEGYWLVIDRSGSGNFSVDNLEYIQADRTTADGKTVYKVKWDVDGSGADNFSFAKARKLFAVVRTLKDPSCADVTAGKVQVEIVAGKANYSYTLQNTNKSINREWRTSDKTSLQKELIESKYTLTLRDGNKEGLTRNFTLSQPDAIHIDLGEDKKLTKGGEIVLDATDQLPTDIQVACFWDNFQGFTSEQKKITVTESGIYRLTVIKQSDGCSFYDEVLVSGADEQRIAVFPTILHDRNYNVTISLPEIGSVNVKTFTEAGVMVGEVKGDGKSEYHFTGTLKEGGLYLVVIQTPLGVETQKIIAY